MDPLVVPAYPVVGVNSTEDGPHVCSQNFRALCHLTSHFPFTNKETDSESKLLLQVTLETELEVKLRCPD